MSDTLHNDQHLISEAPLVEGDHTFSTITDTISSIVEKKPPNGWLIAFLFAFSGKGESPMRDCPSRYHNVPRWSGFHGLQQSCLLRWIAYLRSAWWHRIGWSARLPCPYWGISPALLQPQSPLRWHSGCLRRLFLRIRRGWWGWLASLEGVKNNKKSFRKRTRSLDEKGCFRVS